MRLVDEIIEMASDGKKSLADALRKCLILAFDLKNEKLKDWVENELNGYKRADEIPEYRKATLHSRGNFSGPAGAWIPKRPLPIGIIDKKHQPLLVSKLVGPIGSYEVFQDKDGEAVINWPPDLIVHYQARFIDGFALAQAWQEVPTSLIVGLCEEVRNRLLRFALEIREELGRADNKPENLPQEKVEAAVINHIYGGVNMIGGTVNTQIGNIVIPQGDLESLKNAFRKVQVSEDQLSRLEHAIKEDAKAGQTGIGKKTTAWLTVAGSKVGKAGLAIGQEVAKEWLMQYLGLR
jgi:hypothetical protein